MSGDMIVLANRLSAAGTGEYAAALNFIQNVLHIDVTKLANLGWPAPLMINGPGAHF